MKKKILYLSQLYPYPPNSGGKIKTLNTLLALAKAYEVHAVFISEEAPKKSEIDFLERKGIVIKVFYSTVILASVKDDYLGLFSKFIRGIPHYVFQYTHGPAFPYIAQKIIDLKLDVIHIDHLNLSQYLPDKKNEIWILEHHNVEAYLYWTRFVHTRKLTRKLYLFIEMVLTYIYEYRTVRKFDHIFAISKPEELRTRRMYFIDNVSTQPMVSLGKPVKKKIHAHPRLGFIGTMGWPPNEDAIEWFLCKIFPKIIQVIPDVKFHIIGKPGLRYIPRVQRQIVFHGFQKSLEPLLSRTDVFVLPFRMGGGLRLKALTALSAGLPIVSTPLGIEGLQVQNGKECVIVSDANSFACEVVRLLQNRKLRMNLRRNALLYIASHHGNKNNRLFLEEYDRVNR